MESLQRGGRRENADIGDKLREFLLRIQTEPLLPLVEEYRPILNQLDQEGSDAWEHAYVRLRETVQHDVDPNVVKYTLAQAQVYTNESDSLKIVLDSSVLTTEQLSSSGLGRSAYSQAPPIDDHVGNKCGFYACFSCKTYKSMSDEEKLLLAAYNRLAGELGVDQLTFMQGINTITLCRRVRRAEIQHARKRAPAPAGQSGDESAQSSESGSDRGIRSGFHTPIDPGPSNWRGSSSELAEIDYFLRFANASYGTTLSPHRIYNLTETRAVANMAGLPVDDIAQHVPASAPLRPSYFIAVDHQLERIVISVRGTLNAADALTDVVANLEPVYVALHRPADTSEALLGLAHSGVRRSTQNLYLTIKECVEELLQQNPTYALRFTGHSLGGGVAALLALLFRELNPVSQGRDIKAFLFGPPSILTGAMAKYCEQFVICVINKNDIVPRLSVSAFRFFMAVSHEVKAMGCFERWRKIHLNLMSNEEKIQIVTGIRTEIRKQSPNALKLYVPGIVLLMSSSGQGWKRKMRMREVARDDRSLRRVEMSAGFFYNHWPGNYRLNLNRVLKNNSAKAFNLKLPIHHRSGFISALFESPARILGGPAGLVPLMLFTPLPELAGRQGLTTPRPNPSFGFPLPSEPCGLPADAGLPLLPFLAPSEFVVLPLFAAGADSAALLFTGARFLAIALFPGAPLDAAARPFPFAFPGFDSPPEAEPNDASPSLDSSLPEGEKESGCDAVSSSLSTLPLPASLADPSSDGGSEPLLESCRVLRFAATFAAARRGRRVASPPVSNSAPESPDMLAIRSRTMLSAGSEASTSSAVFEAECTQAGVLSLGRQSSDGCDASTPPNNTSGWCSASVKSRFSSTMQVCCWFGSGCCSRDFLMASSRSSCS
ncbi:Sn1-specific diacylglycerol lipase alpha [Porphyridium purpureum]|uniref:sn-1-specific diacylglycerol lipase n=1 Tax=Porphyridium purpureum TaxID=35688 RepID=A0A5J4YVH9_PORPP|nr:Sn1-specific diacylglycerol lipase alpha [Porphyridium purpureum]|eukprot:POR0851..scf227_4